MGAGKAAPAALGGRQRGHVLAAKAHLASGQRMRADQHVEQCGLARPVGADDADGFIGAHSEVDAVEHHQRVEALVEPAGVEQRIAGLVRHVRSWLSLLAFAQPL